MEIFTFIELVREFNRYKLKEKKVSLTYECGVGGVVIHLRVRL
jgi:hypothetical protein